MPVKVAAGFRIARGNELALGLAATMEQAVRGRLSLRVSALGLLARLAKIDDVTHPQPLTVSRYTMCGLLLGLVLLR